MTRLREQLEGAIQVTVALVLITVAFVASHIQPWNFPELRPLRTFVVLQLAAVAVAYAVLVRAGARRLPGTLPAAALAVLALLSTAWSPHAGLTFGRAAGFAALLLAAWALGAGAAGRPDVVARLLLALLVATVVIALAGLVELWHAYDQAVVPATRGQGARYSGIGQNPNQIAMLLALTLPLALWAARSSAGLARSAWVAAAVLLAGSLVASGSRGAVVGAFAGSLAYLLGVARSRRLAVAAVASAAFVAALLATQLPQPAEENPPLYETFGQTPKLSPRDLNSALPLESEFGFPGENAEPGDRRTLFFSSGRLQAWELGGRQAAERPLLGYGFGTEDETFVDRSYLFVSRVVENSYLGVALQLGLVGLALLLATVALPLVSWMRARVTLDAETLDVGAAAAGTVVAGAFVAVPQSYLTSVGSPPTVPFWIAVFLLAATVARRSPGGATA